MISATSVQVSLNEKDYSNVKKKKRRNFVVKEVGQIGLGSGSYTQFFGVASSAKGVVSGFIARLDCSMTCYRRL
jgi:hypothetical protein